MKKAVAGKMAATPTVGGAVDLRIRRQPRLTSPDPDSDHREPSRPPVGGASGSAADHAPEEERSGGGSDPGGCPADREGVHRAGSR